LAIGEEELVQVAAVPAGEAVIDGIGQLLEGMRAAGREDATRSRPEVLAPASDQVNADGEPGSRHGRTAWVTGGAVCTGNVNLA
jgi:hypothetical protein